MFLDLDGFKHVNDTWGHDMGDHVLQTVATRLQRLLRPSDTVARLLKQAAKAAAAAPAAAVAA